MKLFIVTIFLLLVNNLTGQTFKVVVERFDNGNPKLVRYFTSGKDTSDEIRVDSRIGLRTLNKPITLIAETYFENGQLEYRGKYEKGLATGLFVFYYENGQQLARSYYKNGVPRDSLFCYFPSGKISRLIIEINKKKRYWHNIDFYENGNPAIECYQVQYTDSLVLEGKYIQWYESGSKAFEATLENNWTKGKWKKWDEAGQLSERSDSIRVASFGEEK